MRRRLRKKEERRKLDNKYRHYGETHKHDLIDASHLTTSQIHMQMSTHMYILVDTAISAVSDVSRSIDEYIPITIHVLHGDSTQKKKKLIQHGTVDTTVRYSDTSSRRPGLRRPPLFSACTFHA